MTNFLCWCAGVDTLLITKASPQDRGRYNMLGVFILFTAALSGTSMFFMAKYILSSPLYCGVAALCWALFIFSIDRYLSISISSFKAHLHPEEIYSRKKASSSIGDNEQPNYILSAKAPSGYLFATISRLLVAVFISIVISIPVKLSIFEKEINGFLNQENQTQTDKYFSNNPQINALKEERIEITARIKDLREELKNAQDNMSMRYQNMKDELDGKGVSKTPGFGRYFNQAKDAYIESKTLWQDIQARNEPMITELTNRDKYIQNQIQQFTEKTHQNTEQDDGLLHRYRALSSLAKNSDEIAVTLWLISALFIFIEAFPVMTKASGKRDSYELLLARMAIEKNDDVLAEYYQEKNKSSKFIDSNQTIVPSHYRIYLIILGVLQGVSFPLFYRYLNDYSGALTPQLVIYMFSPLFIALVFLSTELIITRSRILWESLKPTHDLNFSVQALIILIVPIAIVLYLIMFNPTQLLPGSTNHTNPITSHSGFWAGWIGLYLILIINFLGQKTRDSDEAEKNALRNKTIEETEKKLQHGRRVYREGCSALYLLTALCTSCSFVLYANLPLSTPKSLFWQLQLAFTLIPIIALLFYGVHVRVPLSTIISIANSKTKKIYTVSVFFAMTTAIVMCLLYSLAQVQSPSVKMFNQTTVKQTLQDRVKDSI